MRIALAGRPGSGKSTLFDLMAGPSPSKPSGSGLRIAHAAVPDARLDELSAAFRPRKTTPARLEFQDLEQKTAPAYPALSPERREMLTRADLILLVVDLFNVNPKDWLEQAFLQLRQAEEEFAILDLATVESRLEKLRKLIKIGQAPAFPGELELLERLRGGLEVGQSLREEARGEEETRALRGFGFLSEHDILPALNVGEEQLEEARARLTPDPERASEKPGAVGREFLARPLVVFSAEVERQIQEMPPEEQPGFLDAFGLRMSAVAQAIRAAYELAGLHCFFTVGEDEVRAWSVRRGAKAPEAAGVIHSDLEKGFVRAEVLSYEDWRSLGSLAKAKAQGVLRLEGREFEIRDGDIVNFRSGLARSRG